MHFTDHALEVNEEKNPIDAQLFTMTGKRWRAFRWLNLLYPESLLEPHMHTCTHMCTHTNKLVFWKQSLKPILELMLQIYINIITRTSTGIKSRLVHFYFLHGYKSFIQYLTTFAQKHFYEFILMVLEFSNCLKHEFNLFFLKY